MVTQKGRACVPPACTTRATLIPLPSAPACLPCHHTALGASHAQCHAHTHDQPKSNHTLSHSRQQELTPSPGCAPWDSSHCTDASFLSRTATQRAVRPWGNAHGHGSRHGGAATRQITYLPVPGVHGGGPIRARGYAEVHVHEREVTPHGGHVQGRVRVRVLKAKPLGAHVHTGHTGSGSTTPVNNTEAQSNTGV